MPFQPLVGPSSALISTDKATQLEFLRLPHPRTGLPALFLPFPPTGPTSSPYFANQGETEQDSAERPEDVQAKYGGLLELQVVSGAKDADKSWFVMRDDGDDQVISDGNILLLTPIDPLFLLLPLLLAVSPVNPFSAATSPTATAPAEDATASPGRFEASESLFDRATTAWHGDSSSATPILAKDIETFTSLPLIRRTLSRVCDALGNEGAGGNDEMLWRLSKDKVLNELGKKVERVAKASEEAAAEARRRSEDEGDPSVMGRMLVREELDDAGGVPENVIQDARIKIALDIVCGYLPSSIADTLHKSFPLTSLTAHRAHIAAHRAHIAAACLSTTYNPGRPSSSAAAGVDAGFDESKPLKKEKAKVQKASRGVEALKKASTRGMSKLGEMWGKAKENADKAKAKIADAAAEGAKEDVTDGKGKAKEATSVEDAETKDAAASVEPEVEAAEAPSDSVKAASKAVKTKRKKDGADAIATKDSKRTATGDAEEAEGKKGEGKAKKKIKKD